MIASALVAILATSALAASRYEVVNDGEEVEVRQLPDLPVPEPEEREERSFFSDVPPLNMLPSWGPAQLADAYISAARQEDRKTLLIRLGEVKARDDKDLRALLNLYAREDAGVRAQVEACLMRLTPVDIGLSPFFAVALQDEEPVFQIFGLIGAGRLRDPRTLDLIRGLAEKDFPAPETSISMSPADAYRFTLQFNAVRLLADWEGEKVLPLVLKRSQDVPGAGEIAALAFWEKALEDFVAWSESKKPADRARAAKAWGAPVSRIKLAATKPRLWQLALDPRRSVTTRHRAAIKLGICAEEADVDRFLAERAKADGKVRALLDAGLFASRHPKAIPPLVGYAKEASDPLARAGALFQLRSMMPPADYRTLLEWVAKNDGDRENRANAAAELSGR
ncbi:MAG: hypothetical protein FD126_2852 [Elusimicrobia bacterium]|nr:MAG: hypothetical protein FD126_2852 [Elusimicrobiota bacterium]